MNSLIWRIPFLSIMAGLHIVVYNNHGLEKTIVFYFFIGLLIWLFCDLPKQWYIIITGWYFLLMSEKLTRRLINHES